MFVNRKGCHTKDRGRPVGRKSYRGKGIQGISCTALGVKFHKTLKKSKLKTFSELNKKVKFKSKTANEIILKADRALFGQMVIIAENRQLHMRDVLCHPLGPLPWALSTVDGSLRKTSKATRFSKGAAKECTCCAGNSSAICMHHRWHSTSAKVER